MQDLRRHSYNIPPFLLYYYIRQATYIQYITPCYRSNINMSEFFSKEFYHINCGIIKPQEGENT